MNPKVSGIAFCSVPVRGNKTSYWSEKTVTSCATICQWGCLLDCTAVHSQLSYSQLQNCFCWEGCVWQLVDCLRSWEVFVAVSPLTSCFYCGWDRVSKDRLGILRVKPEWPQSSLSPRDHRHTPCRKHTNPGTRVPWRSCWAGLLAPLWPGASRTRHSPETAFSRSQKPDQCELGQGLVKETRGPTSTHMEPASV